MKPDIHPEYRQVLFHDTSVDHYFLVGSPAQTEETMEYEGQTYPYVQLELSSASHPFYTDTDALYHSLTLFASRSRHLSHISYS